MSSKANQVVQSVANDVIVVAGSFAPQGSSAPVVKTGGTEY